MAILICGGAGYIGSHINMQLNRAGYETITFDNLVSGHREAVKWGSFVKGDLANIADIEKVFSERQIDAVFHLAAYAYVGESVEEPAQVPVTEDIPQNPINPYGMTKLTVERIFRDYQKAYGLQFVVLRYFNAAGADPAGEIGESHNPETHIIPLVLDAASGSG